ncbi:GNAT family N-acetyltransferase [Terasakiella sp. SH-1]|uniref:GNAT family N-acetyltransferase n=1 Tax=Terasakiella sp. SH-1 TaxID=2560057 RepID=UPI001073FF71|nr:GNAT family N-acetyltransferase [Terasakiella sp. SH-1]
MIIRPIEINDYGRWFDLWQAYLSFYDVQLDDDVSEGVWERLMNEDDKDLWGLVAEQDGQVIGFTHYFFHGTTWHPTSYCYLEDLFVDENARANGAGRALINGVKDAAQDEGAAKLYWHTNKNNERAQALYNKVANLCDFIRYDIPL